MKWTAGQGGALRGRIEVPGDKSISHRALMLAAVADGRTEVHGFLEGEDTRATAAIFSRLGVRIDAPARSVRVVDGAGLSGLRAAPTALDCGNAGTGMRLLAGLLAGQSFDSELIGDASLSRRPMLRVVEPLRRMGARIDTATGGTAPLRIHGGARLQGGEYDLQVASAQVKSAILFAGLYADGISRVREPHPTRDYTESMLRAFGVELDEHEGWIVLTPPRSLCSPGRIDVPGDFSSAAFFLVAASIVPGSDLLVANVGLHPRRTGLLDSLREMGAQIEVLEVRESDGHKVADLRVRYAPLHGIDVPPSRVPDMIDEFPALFAAAALAEGATRVSGAGELRVKESDRIAVMAAGLRTLGVDVDERPDGAEVLGGLPGGGHVDSAGDHRCAMALAVLAQRAARPVLIDDCANVATSFPGFSELAASVGIRLNVAAS